MTYLDDLGDVLRERVPEHIQHAHAHALDTMRIYTGYVFDQLNKYGPPLPAPLLSSLGEVGERVQRIWEGVSDRVRAAAAGGGVFTAISPPPAPPPPPPTRMQLCGRWLQRHARQLLVGTAGAAAIVAGLVLAHRLGYLPSLRKIRARMEHRRRPVRGALAPNGTRTQAVIVLGADTALGRAIALHLAELDLIVLASVADDRARSALEAEVPPSARGYVKVLLFDPCEPEAEQAPFFRAVHSTLSLRFPLGSAGDPFARPGENVQVLGIVNALSFATEADVRSGSPPDGAANQEKSGPALGRPLGHLGAAQLGDALNRHVVSPLTLINSLLSIVGTLPNRTERTADRTPALVLSLVAAPASRVALPLQGAASLVSHAAISGIHTLRRESEQQWIGDRTGMPLVWTWVTPPHLTGSWVQTPELRVAPNGNEKPRAPQRRIRWTVLEVESERGLPLAGTTTAERRAANAERAVLPRGAPPAVPAVPTSKALHPALPLTARLMLGRTRRIRPFYTVSGMSYTQWAWTRVRNAVLDVLPHRLLDMLLLVQTRFQLRRTGLVPPCSPREHMDGTLGSGTDSPANDAESAGADSALPGSSVLSSGEGSERLSASVQTQEQSPGTVYASSQEAASSDDDPSHELIAPRMPAYEGQESASTGSLGTSWEYVSG